MCPCWYCGASLKGGKRTRDHVVPKAKGGTYGKKVDACERCNNKKADLTIHQFREKFFGGKEFWFERVERENRFV